MVNEVLNSTPGNQESSPFSTSQYQELEAFYLSGGNEDYILKHQDAEISEEQKATVQSILSQQQFPKNREHDLLSHIEGPIDTYGIDAVFLGERDSGGHLTREGVVESLHEKRILAIMTGLEWDEYDQVSPENLRIFYERFPTPMDFERISEDFLKIIRTHNGEEKYKEYVSDLEKFKKKIYGKKLEYWEAMKTLHAEAEAKESKKHQHSRGLGGRVLDALRGVIGHSEQKTAPEKTLHKLSSKESLETLLDARLEGDPIAMTRVEARPITHRELLDHDLAPKFEVDLEGVSYRFSRAFKLHGRRDAVIAYIKTPDGKIYTRGYYCSGSQGVWRYLPDYALDKDGDAEWYGKGINEQQLTLPMEIQGSLNEIAKISQEGKTDQEVGDDPEIYELFFGTAKVIPEDSDYHEDRLSGRISDTLSREVESYPRITPRQKIEELGPEEMDISESYRPDYAHQIAEFRIHVGIYKGSTAHVFKSKDGELKWTIIEDESGRAFIASVETNSPITSTGLRKSWIDAGNFTIPLYEYPSQDHGFGDDTDKRKDYVCMWKNCLSKMPIIRHFMTRE